MGTRAAYGFRVDGEDKIEYNHSDGYPEGLGTSILSFVAESSIDELKSIAENIELVDEQGKPTLNQIKELKKIKVASDDAKKGISWYEALRTSQGEPSFFKDGLKYMTDSKGFLNDSLFCEYAYIINVDTNKLEFYAGFNRKARPKMGRYAKNKEGSYYGVVLLDEINLSDICNTKESEVADKIKPIVEKMQELTGNFSKMQEVEEEKKIKKVKISPKKIKMLI